VLSFPKRRLTVYCLMTSLKVITEWPKVPDSFAASPVSSQQSVVVIRFQLRKTSDTNNFAYCFVWV